MPGILDQIFNPQEQPDTAQQILANRFQPQNDYQVPFASQPSTLPYQDPMGFFQQISGMTQPTLADAAKATMLTATTGGKFVDPSEVTAQRMAPEMAMAKAVSEIQGNRAMLNGGATGALVQRYMQATGASFPEALQMVQTGFRSNTMLGPNGEVMPQPGALGTIGNMAYSKEMGSRQAQEQTAAPIAANTEIGKTSAENAQMAAANTDIVGQYQKLIADSKSAPSGALESGVARLSNVANMPTEGAIAQGTFDADLNNLYLATIRSLKGTGRVMEQELNRIAESAPKPTDSNEVKIAKANAHMQYYQHRMQQLGFDPQSGQPLNSRAALGTQGDIPVGFGSPVNLQGASDQNQRIPIITPDGQPGTIDPEHLQDLLDDGGQLAQ